MLSSIGDALKRFGRRVKESAESGATAVEYGLMVALIAVVIIVAVALLGQNLRSSFDCTAKSIGAGEVSTADCPDGATD